MSLFGLRKPSILPGFFGEWKRANPADLAFNECVGYKVPLFLGGEDSLDNLELSDLEVYWSLMGQLRIATQGVTPGTRIDGVDIRDGI